MKRESARWILCWPTWVAAVAFAAAFVALNLIGVTILKQTWSHGWPFMFAELRRAGVEPTLTLTADKGYYDEPFYFYVDMIVAAVLLAMSIYQVEQISRSLNARFSWRTLLFFAVMIAAVVVMEKPSLSRHELRLCAQAMMPLILGLSSLSLLDMLIYVKKELGHRR